MLMEAEIPASRAIMHLCIYICSKLKANEMLHIGTSRQQVMNSCHWSGVKHVPK